MEDFKVWFDPETREVLLNLITPLIGIEDAEENPSGAYCPLPLTGIPDLVKRVFVGRQKTLTSKVLGPVGISSYDPANAPLSPDRDLDAPPEIVYGVDATRIAENRYCAGHVIYPSSGQGVESQIAVFLNRFSMLLFDNNIRVSRMWPPCTMYVGYDDFDAQAGEISKIFQFLQGYDPGLGKRDGKAVLLGFAKNGSEIIDVRRAVNDNFPEFAYRYDKNRELPAVNLLNPTVYREYRRKVEQK